MTMHKDNTMVMLWKDKRVVQLITTFHNADTIHKQRTRTSDVQGQIRLTEVEIQKPQLVEDYNQYMSGVDRLDQMVKYHDKEDPQVDKKISAGTSYNVHLQFLCAV